MRTYRIPDLSKFHDIVEVMREDFLIYGKRIDVGEWQSQDIRGNEALVTRELQTITLHVDRVVQGKLALVELVEPNMPWAEDHFQERVSGIPHNPPPSHKIWPYAQSDNEAHRDGEQFSHTYPERIWSRALGMHGIRFRHGDLNDVVDLLDRSRYTRQAFLPIWFPEDTGAHHQKRVPCTLGYHFLIRPGISFDAPDRLHLTYYIRSCDFIRHFRDDVYMAIRLGQWVAEKLCDRVELMSDERLVTTGSFTMHIGSFHIFEGDVWKLTEGHDV